MPKTPFTKPALLLEDQVELLRGRGLSIPDADRARRYLENISYYRLSGYTRYFADASDERRERFRENTTFDDVVGLYVFDRKLRVLLAEAFERIEVAVKGGIAYHGSITAHPFWITDPTYFDSGKHSPILKLVDDAVSAGNGPQKQVFLKAFYDKYNNQYPPAWMITEVLSFHGASIIYKFSKGAIRLKISNQFDLQQDILESWLHSLVFARNVCAHHSRFWNRRFTIKPKIPRLYANCWPQASQDRVYVICCIVKHMLEKLGGETTWPDRLRALIRERPNVPVSDMGFPEDWEHQSFWNFEAVPE